MSYDIAATVSTALVEAIDTSTLFSCAYGIAVWHGRTSRRTRGLVRQREKRKRSTFVPADPLICCLEQGSVKQAH